MAKIKNWEMIRKSQEYEKRYNPNRPDRKDYPNKRALKIARQIYNANITLGEDGILPYMRKWRDQIKDVEISKLVGVAISQIETIKKYFLTPTAR